MTPQENSGSVRPVLPFCISVAIFAVVWAWFYLMSITQGSPAWFYVASLGDSWRRNLQMGMYVIPILLPVGGILCYRAQRDSWLYRFLFVPAFVASLLPAIILLSLGVASQLGFLRR